MPLKRGPSGALGVQMFGQQAGSDNSSSQSIVYAPQNTYNIGEGADKQAVADLKRAQSEDRGNFTRNVGKAVQNLRKRNVRV